MNLLRAVLLLSFLQCNFAAQTSRTANSKATEQKSSQGQNETSMVEGRIAELPIAKQTFRPKLSLQHALKIAESYIKKEKIDISTFYLHQVKFTLHGDKESRRPAWHFWWQHENGGLGNYVEILVFIDSGEVGRIPSM